MDIRSLALQAGVDHRGKQDMIDLKDPEILEKEREGYMEHVIFQVGMWVGHSNTFFPKQLVQLRVLYIFSKCVPGSKSGRPPDCRPPDCRLPVCRPAVIP